MNSLQKQATQVIRKWAKGQQPFGLLGKSWTHYDVDIDIDIQLL